MMTHTTRRPAIPEDEEPGLLGERFVAHVIDAIILFVPLMALWVLVLRQVPFVAATIVTNGLSLAYFVLMEAFRGRTLGKQVRGLRVYGIQGGSPTVKQALLRNLYLALGIIQGLLGSVLSLGVIIWIVVTISRDTTWRQGIHDRFANETYVTRTARP